MYTHLRIDYNEMAMLCVHIFEHISSRGKKLLKRAVASISYPLPLPTDQTTHRKLEVAQ